MYMDNDNKNPCGISEMLLEKMSCGCADHREVERSDMQGCNMGRHSWGLENYPLAMVYSPLQKFCDLYDLDDALESGTLFKELDLPFKGESVAKGGCCRG